MYTPTLAIFLRTPPCPEPPGSKKSNLCFPFSFCVHFPLAFFPIDYTAEVCKLTPLFPWNTPSLLQFHPTSFRRFFLLVSSFQRVLLFPPIFTNRKSSASVVPSSSLLPIPPLVLVYPGLLSPRHHYLGENYPSSSAHRSS